MIRTADISDAENIAAIEQESFTHHPWTKAMFQSALADPLYTFYVYEQEGILAGFACMKDAGEEAEIEYIAVAKPFRRRGIATRLLNALISASVEKGAQAIFLEVGAQNLPAVALYEKHGFTRISVRKNYYGEGRDAFVYQRILHKITHNAHRTMHNE